MKKTLMIGLMLGIILFSGCKLFIEPQGVLTGETPQHCEEWLEKNGTETYTLCITDKYECHYHNNQQYEVCLERFRDYGVEAE